MKAIHDLHHHIHENQVVWSLEGGTYRHLSVFDHVHLVSHARKHVMEHLLIDRIVLSYEDMSGG